jgi:hypothetical protein
MDISILGACVRWANNSRGVSPVTMYQPEVPTMSRVIGRINP